MEKFGSGEEVGPADQEAFEMPSGVMGGLKAMGNFNLLLQGTGEEIYHQEASWRSRAELCVKTKLIKISVA